MKHERACISGVVLVLSSVSFSHETVPAVNSQHHVMTVCIEVLCRRRCLVCRRNLKQHRNGGQASMVCFSTTDSSTIHPMLSAVDEKSLFVLD